jgi:hypothetical protein
MTGEVMQNGCGAFKKMGWLPIPGRVWLQGNIHLCDAAGQWVDKVLGYLMDHATYSQKANFLSNNRAQYFDWNI